MSDEQLIAWGVNCMWWDAIEETRILPSGLPVCPHCGSVLLQIEESQWWEGVDDHEKEGHPDYRKRIEWARGKCFKTPHLQELAWCVSRSKP